jgi:hypothetical protein
MLCNFDFFHPLNQKEATKTGNGLLLEKKYTFACMTFVLAWAFCAAGRGPWIMAVMHARVVYFFNC